MKVRSLIVGLAAVAAVSASVASSGMLAPASADAGGIATRSYVQTNLVSDIPGLAAHTDPNLKNPWGTSVGPGSPIWVSDNHAGVTTLYDGAGNPQPLVVAIPAPPSAGKGAVGAPTGQAFNTFDPTSSDFVISENGKLRPRLLPVCDRRRNHRRLEPERRTRPTRSSPSTGRRRPTAPATSARSTRAWRW